jgi:predicted alpha/beta hydrolase family esterase
MKKEGILIGGGETFRDIEHAKKYYSNKDIDVVWGDKFWHAWLMWSLEPKYNFIKPKMPGSDNAHYELWKIIFEKYLNKITQSEIDVVCHSLGTIFLMKYLVENGFKNANGNIKIKNLHLVAPIVDNKFQPADDVEDCGTFAFDISKVSEIKKYCENIHIWHSTDDTMCRFANTEYLLEQIPEIILHKFENRSHFLDTTFWELFDEMRK